jgi:hypothetical protein
MLLVGVTGETRILKLTLFNPSRVPLDIEIVFDGALKGGVEIEELERDVLPKEKLCVEVPVRFTKQLTLGKRYEIQPKIANVRPGGKRGKELKADEATPTLDVSKFIVCRVKA